MIDPPRELDTAALTDIDLVVISHHHSDHFNLTDLAMIPGATEHTFVIPDDVIMEATLLDWGASRVVRLSHGQCIEARDMRLTATPSDVPFAEMGILFQQGELQLLNLVDTVFHPRLAELITLCKDGPDVVLAPFQAGGYMSFLPLRLGGPPPGLLPAIESWSREYLEELTADLLQLQPRLAVAFADGLAYEDAGINARHFPLPDSVFISRLAASGINACSARPGVLLEVSKDHSPHVAEATHKLVCPSLARAAQRCFDPTVPISDTPLSWYDLPSGGRGNSPREDWRCIVENHLAAKLLSLMSFPKAEHMREVLSAWYLEMLDAGKRVLLTAEWPLKGVPAIRYYNALPASRTYGIVCHGVDLAQVVLGHLPLDAITLGGLFRYRSPQDDGELEKLRGRVLRPLEWLFG